MTHEDYIKKRDELIVRLTDNQQYPEYSDYIKAKAEAAQAIDALVLEVIGEEGKLLIPDYPRQDDEGEPLWSKRAAAEGRKQVTARYHSRKELRAEQRHIVQGDK